MSAVLRSYLRYEMKGEIWWLWKAKEDSTDEMCFSQFTHG